MPWGEKVTITFRGRVPKFYELPSDAEPFDMWQDANGDYWIWAIRSGWNHYQWVDP